MNLSDERESSRPPTPSFAKWTSTSQFVDGDPVPEVPVEAIGLLDEDRADGRIALRNATISPKPPRPACLAVSTSTYSCATETPFAAAYSLRSFNCAGIENPSFSCSLEETRA